MALKESLMPSHKERVITATSIPFLQDALADAGKKGIFIGRTDIAFMPDGTGDHAKNYLSTQVNRQIDLTGIIAPLVGLSSSPEQTKEMIYPLVQKLIDRWEKDQKWPKIKEILTNQKQCDLETLLELDRSLGQIVKDVKQLSPIDKPDTEAARFRKRTTEDMDKLAAEKGGIARLVSRQLSFDPMGHLTDISENITVPAISETNREQLEKILPKQLRRETPTQPGELTDVEIVLRELGRVGNDFTRAIITILQEKQKMQSLYEATSMNQS